jgi:26S proteasome regulatory subunit N6
VTSDLAIYRKRVNHYLRPGDITVQTAVMAQGESRLKTAQSVAKSDPRQAEQIYKEIISKPPSITSDAAVREYETALVSLAELYRDEKKTQELVDLVTTSRTVLSTFAKAKTAKLGRSQFLSLWG